jgi:hypothetical protein
MWILPSPAVMAVARIKYPSFGFTVTICLQQLRDIAIVDDIKQDV